MAVTARILIGDALEQLKAQPDAFVQTCVTSPPYWGLRDYEHDGQLGLEPDPRVYVERLVEVFAEVRRVLKPDGTLWLNLGDSYSRDQHTGGQSDFTKSGLKRDGRKESSRVRTLSSAKELLRPKSEIRRELPPEVKPKDLVGIPWRVAFALQAAGWWLRCDVIWNKPSAMPESVTDRPTRSHEYLFLLAKSERYFYDAKAIAEPTTGTARPRGNGVNPKATANAFGSKQNESWSAAVRGPVEMRNRRSVWAIQSVPFPGAHFATFPPELPRLCIMAGSRQGDTVLDPFTGSGTTGAAALELGRSFLGCELNPAYAEIAERRMRVTHALPFDQVSE